MEFAVYEMNKEKLFPKENVISGHFNQADSNAKPDVAFVEATAPLIKDELNSEIKSKSTQEKTEENSNICIGTVSVLLKDNDREKCHELIEDNSIKKSIKTSASLSTFSDEFLNCHAPTDTSIVQQKRLKRSYSYHDISALSSKLSNSLSHISFDGISNISNYKGVLIAENEGIGVNTTFNDDGEYVFDNKVCLLSSDNKSLEKCVVKEKDEKCQTKSDFGILQISTQLPNIDEKSMTNNNHAGILTNLLKYDRNSNKEQKSPEVITNIQSQSNLTCRPTLVDDSRLVKISLPTNPINIMQSNAQFFNKSRNFLNFITEKSTNIMEKALLPQHLQMKYNSVMKSIDNNIDNNYNERKCAEESPNTEFVLIEPVFTGLSEVATKTKPAANILKDSTDVKGEQNTLSKVHRNKNTLTINSTDKNRETGDECALVNDCMLDKYNSSISSLKEKNLKQLDSYIAISDTDKTNDNILSMKMNGDFNINTVVLNSEDDHYREDVAYKVYQQDEESIDLEDSKHKLLQQSEYLTLLGNYADLKSKHVKLQKRLEHLEERNRSLETENKGDILSAQIETFEKTINRLTYELHTSLDTQEMLKRDYNAANKERESMVMKYAVSEKQLIDTQRAKEYAERKIKEITAQQELLQTKLREMQGERVRICNIMTNKHRELTDLQREVEKLREDVKIRDIKLQWTQNKLKTEMDLQKETQQKLDKATTRINEMKEECHQVRKETQETMRKFQQSEENKAVTLDQQLKEQQARLILERHVTEDKEMLRLQLQKEVDALRHRQQVLIEENNMLSLKIQDAEKHRLHYESNLNNLNVIADQRQKEIEQLLSKVSELETLKIELYHKNQYVASTEAEIQHVRLINEELQSDMSACRQKEAELLDFTQKLTDKNVRLLSEFAAIEAKAKQLEQEHGPLHEQIKSLTEKTRSLEENFDRERKVRIQEYETLATLLAEQTQLAQKLTQQLEDTQGENAVLKRKQQISLKEMTRELQQCRRKLEMFEAASPYNSLGAGSRTASNASLNAGDTINGALSDNSINGDQSIQPIEPSKQVLIDRIIKLQESNARKAEKLDFFEEHTRILVEELQKKKRIIQTYILHENIGAMGNNERDKYKAELARHGGIMASVYNQRVSDDNMTLELSLEINQKLQAVLEDALFKNITLKDNIDTLGEEIARLTMQHQKRQNAN